ncbi:MAG TPA: thioredoxin family protein [Gammaproteobacteria bacterium]|nr:thioredoxin family protein [Gammaproteobacteria bacterium]
MNVTIIATRGCSHCPNLARELDDLGITYDVQYVEDSPEIVEKYTIRHSPNLLVDGELVCRSQPTEADLRSYLKLE